jgi:hypothetical protein
MLYHVEALFPTVTLKERRILSVEENQMNLLWLFDSCGFIVGPAILLAAVCAVVLCFRASRSSSSRRARRLALAAAVSPVAVAVCGAASGFIVWWSAGLVESPWVALGKVCLAGLVIAALPVGWALFLLRCQPNSDSGASVG